MAIRVEGVNEGIVLWYLSTDELPVGGKVPNGTLAICIDDTSVVMIYDAENKVWHPVK